MTFPRSAVTNFKTSSTMTAQKCKESSHKEIRKHLQLVYSFGLQITTEINIDYALRD